MKLMKQITVLFLCFLMLSSGPVSAFAQTSVSGNDVVVETTTATETTEVCEECGGSNAHTDTCAQYAAPIEEVIETDGPKVGDTIWIKSGSCVYKRGNGQNSYTLTKNYEVLIEEVFTAEEDTVWYKFKFLSVGKDEGGLNSYKYVKAEDTSIEKPDNVTVAPHSCNCEYPPESGNLADHTDSCARKQYVKTLFDGKTAEEIYAAWRNYDKITQTDLLNMLERWNPSVFGELQNLLNGGSEPSEEVLVAIEQLKATKNRNEFEEIFSKLSDEIKNQFTDEQLKDLEQIRESLSTEFENKTEYGGLEIAVNVTGDIPVNADVTTKPVMGEDLVDVGFSFEEHDHMLMALNITIYDDKGEEWQPEPGNPITISFDVRSLGLEDGEVCKVYHKHADEDPIVSEHEVEDGFINYETDKLSVMAVAGDYPLVGSAYKSYKKVYWDVAVPIGSGFPTHKRGEDTSRVTEVTLNGTTVAKGNSDGRSPSEWEIETAKTLSSYYSGTSVGSNSNTKKLTITPDKGYYVTGVTVACTATQKANGFVYMSNAYHCGTWESGNEYTQTLSYESSGAVTIDLPSLAFCHLSNNMEVILNDNGLYPTTDGTLEYFILIEVAPLPSPLFVEYDYGTITDYITDETKKNVFTGSAATWVTCNTSNGPSGSLTIDTPNTQFRYKYTNDNLTDEQKGQEAAKWKHYAGAISPEAVTAARSAGYVFDGWKATYYTNCSDSKVTPSSSNKNVNYTYSFSSQVGSANTYQAGNEIVLRSHVKLVAQWKKLDTYKLTIKKTVNDLNNYENGDLQYNIYLAVDGKPYSGKAKLNGSMDQTISNGKLTLTDDQYYEIEGLYKGTTYSISEKISETKAPTGYKYKTPTYKIGSGTATTTEPRNETLSGNTTVVITNELEVIPYTLTIKKTVTDPANVENDDVSYPVTLTVNGSLYSGDAKLNGETSVTITNGKLNLKDGQWYVIEGLKSGDNYSVEEDLLGVIAPAGYEYSNPTYQIGSGAATTTAPNNQTLSGDTTVLITNELECKLVTLTIKKELIAPTGVNYSNIEYPVILMIAGKEYSGNAKLNGTTTTHITNGKLTLKDGQWYVIEGLTVGTEYSIEENLTSVETPYGYEYEVPTYKVDSMSATAEAANNVTLEQNTEVVITNELKGVYGDLLISKTGILSVDHHEYIDDFRCEETQSTIYQVQGNGIDMQVAIVGNSSALIKNLPIGEYTVTELEDWSWRYDAANAVQKPVVTAGQTAEAPFSNARTNQDWLSGDCYVENWFNTQGIKKRNGSDNVIK